MLIKSLRINDQKCMRFAEVLCGGQTDQGMCSGNAICLASTCYCDRYVVGTYCQYHEKHPCDDASACGDGVCKGTYDGSLSDDDFTCDCSAATLKYGKTCGRLSFSITIYFGLHVFFLDFILE